MGNPTTGAFSWLMGALGVTAGGGILALDTMSTTFAQQLGVGAVVAVLLIVAIKWMGAQLEKERARADKKDQDLAELNRIHSQALVAELRNQMQANERNTERIELSNDKQSAAITALTSAINGQGRFCRWEQR